MRNRPFYNEFNTGTEKIQTAWKLALKAHTEQKYGLHPYSNHLEDVVNCLQKFGFKTSPSDRNSPADGRNCNNIEDIICAAWLHDVVEDTSITISDIESQFGFAVSEIVARVTDEKAATRHERKALTYPKIRGHFGATVVKLADRISNVKASLASDQQQFQKYADEQEKFHAATYVPMLAEPMWAYLRFLLEQSFEEKPAPLKEARLFCHQRPDVKIEVKAAIDGEDLRIDEYAIGSSIKLINDGDSDYERILTIKAENKNSVTLSLLKQRFHGNSAYSEVQEWLSENGIPFESWSG
jgi:hypothetical protein